MILCHEHIKHAFDSGVWTAYRNGNPVSSSELHINPNSIDVSLGNSFLSPEWPPLVDEDIDPFDFNIHVDLYDPRSIGWEEVKSQKLLLQEGRFVLAHTAERFDCSEPLLIDGKARYFIPQLEGRSTVARCGLSVHSSAGYGDVGFSSSWTLELTTTLPIILRPGDRIAQVFFVEASSGTVKYDGAYTDQHDGPRAPVLGEERFR